MSGPLQVIPAGLLGFLQLKNAGQNPRDLVDSVQPTFDLWRHYLASYGEIWNQASTFIQAGPVGAVGFGAFNTLPIVVPTQQWWYVHSYNVRVVVAAGDTYRYQCAYRTNQLSTAHVEIADSGNVVTADAATWDPNKTFRDFLVPPGTEFGIWATLLTVSGANSGTFIPTLRFTRLPI